MSKSDRLLQAMTMLSEASQILFDEGQVHLSDMTDTIVASVAIRYENFQRQETAA